MENGFTYMHAFRTKIDVTNKYCKENCVFLDLFPLHNIVVGRAIHLQPAWRVRPVKKFILSHDLVRVSVRTGMRTENSTASAAMGVTLDVREMQGCALPMP